MSLIEELTQEFYSWEKRCRGWDVFPYPVDLEPPFEPFFFHSQTGFKPSKYVDDGVRPTLVSGFISRIKDIFDSKTESTEKIEENEPLLPFEFDDLAEELIAFSISLPKDQKINPGEVERLLLMLSVLKYPISFEIIANNRSIRIQFVCRKSDHSHVEDQIRAYYPSCHFQEGELDDILPEGKHGYILDFGLKEEFMRPLATSKNFELDPLIGLFGILENLRQDEQAAVQVLFKGVQNPWAESILRSVTDNNGDSFFINAPEMVKLAEEKVSSPLFGVVVRVICLNDSGDQALVQRFSQIMIQITGSATNQLIPLSTKGYLDSDFFEDIYLRQSHRLGMILNCKELATLVHFPSNSVVSRKLVRDSRKTKEAPAIFLGHKLVLGNNYHQGEKREISINREQRLKHVHIIGATGTGKSTLIHSMIVQDIQNGEGLGVIDPHGDLIENIIPYIPSERHQDVIILDPADADYPVGFNILTAHSEIEKEILSSDLVAVFKRLSTSWGDQMNSVFANAILAFLESSKGGTLIDLRKFLIEKDFRNEFLKTVNDPSIVYYWNKEFPILKSTSIGPILTRLDAFLRPKVIRNMVAQNKSLDFEGILDNRKILLIKLSQGLIGEENSYLMGAFLVSKLQQAAMARQAKTMADRCNFYLYIDEFQNFITPSMSAILSGARKYHLGLILAHQDMQQLSRNDSQLASSVVANVGTRICFRIGDTDAKKFEGNFAYFDAFDLQNLDTGQAIIRIERPENDCNFDTIPSDYLEPEAAQETKKIVCDLSRQAYGTPKENVESQLRSKHGIQEQSKEKIKTKTEETEKLPLLKPEPRIPSALPAIAEVFPRAKKPETQHRYLQTLIKKMSESRGYKASIEEPTPDGTGRVDVSLERNGKKIAIEIKDTTDDEWELGNIEKCLIAGYDLVIECTNETKTLDRLRKKVEMKFDESERKKIKVFSPDDLFLFLDSEIAKEASTETRVKGYRVKVEYTAIPESEMTRKRESIAQSVVRSLKEKKK